MSYKDVSEYIEQQTEKRPKPEKSVRRLGKVAIILLATVVAGSAAIANSEEIGNYLEKTIFYSSVDKNIDGPKVRDNGLGRPDILPVHKTAEITKEKLPAGKIFELEDGANLRTCPVFGKDGDKTTLATLEQPVLLFDVEDYVLCVDTNGDSFYGFLDNDAQEAFPNVKIEEGDGRTWVNTGEANIIDNPEN